MIARLAAACACALLPSVQAASAQTHAPPPRLVVVLVVDQLRPDYLHRYRRFFGQGGFERLLTGGAVLTAARYTQAVTKTCPGHAVVMTGSSPNVNGIISNEWFNVARRGIEYCARDEGAPLIGVNREGRSPRNLIGSTVGDELRMHSGGASRVVTIAAKDRSAIMLGGHLPTAAYWMEDTLWVTSTYYRTDLPQWVRRFNASGAITQHFGKTWDRALPMESYAGLGPDDDPAERLQSGLGRTFPHHLGVGETRPGPIYVGALEYSPFQNEIVIEFAQQAIRDEDLGVDDIPDILGVSLASNDRIGHAFGPDSHEVLDVTYRTDRLLARFFEFLDRQVGLDNMLIVLTADHGVAPMAEVMLRMNPRSGALRLHPDSIARVAAASLDAKYGPSPESGWILHLEGPYIYLDESLLGSRGIAVEDAEETVKAALERTPWMFGVHTRTELKRLRDTGQTSDVLLSFHPARSGNILYLTAPFVTEADEPGADHGSRWLYDTHVPLLWHGPGIRPGIFSQPALVSDIAPTLSTLLGVPRPAAAEGRVLSEILR